MRIFVIGGTVFVGRHFVEAALERGHAITLFHRGQHGPDLFPGVDHVLGDRDGGLQALQDKAFDAVVDTCGYLPRIVRQSVEAFAGHVPSYLFVSTISVYRDDIPAGSHEDGNVIELEDPSVEEITGETYGGLKVLCEREVLKRYPKAFIVRPGLIAGPHDPTNRFTYWVDRLARGGDVLVPDSLGNPLQLIDVRDLANFMVIGLERGLEGIYNAAGDEATFGEMIEACHRLNLGAQLVYASTEFLGKEGIELWQELPLAGEDATPLMQIDSAKARRAGLELRSWVDTARDTLAWRRTLPDDMPLRHGLDPEKEARALASLAST